jgi:hypothetical protein
VSQRMHLVFSDSMYSVLKRLSEERGVSMADVLRAAIGKEKWFEETRREGGRVLVERNGIVREVIDTSVR